MSRQTEEITYFRYMSEAEAKAVRETGFLRGGNPGEVFFTKDYYKNALLAKSRLALGDTPQVRMRFRIVNDPHFTKQGAPVRSGNGEPGGGTEYETPDRVEAEVIAVDNLEL